MFPGEQEYVLGPYQRWLLGEARLARELKRYVISVYVQESSRADPWLTDV
jgi:hypothetical protein